MTLNSVKGISPPIIEFKKITKKFGNFFANTEVSFSVAQGSIHGIIGENGAGKSTAMRLLFGLIKPTSGSILLNGQNVNWNSPSAAIRSGIGMVHQHFMLAGRMSAMENILLGAEPTYPSFSWLPAIFQPINYKQARTDLKAIMNRYNLEVDLDSPIEILPIGMQQRVEILKLLFRQVRILILDEPTAVLSPLESEVLFKNIAQLRNEGKTILLISHKLKEICKVTEKVTVLRQGKVVADRATEGLDEQKLANYMIGRSINLPSKTPGRKSQSAEVVLNLSNISLSSRAFHGFKKPQLSDVNLQVHKGEIVGIAGVEGNGQADLVQLILNPQSYFFARRSFLQSRFLVLGAYTFCGSAAENKTLAHLKSAGLSQIPEDRHSQGLILNETAKKNFILGYQRRKIFRSMGLLSDDKISPILNHAMLKFDVQPRQPDLDIKFYSGGNQQKLVIARELLHSPNFLIASHPTRGVDIGAIEFIHQKLIEQSEQGTGILLISSDLDEILTLSDRILVMFEGKIIAEFRQNEVNLDELGLCMGGIAVNE